MAVKLSIFAVILISCVWSVLSMPVAQVLEESKTVTDIVKDEYNDFPRLKRSVIVVDTCPKGMKLFINQCLTPEKIKRLEEEDYNDDVSTAGTTKDITKDGSTQEHLPKFVTEAGATMTGTDDADNTRLKWRKFYKLMATAFAVCCWIGLLFWLPKCLYCVVFRLLDCYFIPSSTTSSSSSLDIRCQRELRRNEVESSHFLLPSLTETISDATSMDPILTLQ